MDLQDLVLQVCLEALCRPGIQRPLLVQLLQVILEFLEYQPVQGHPLLLELHLHQGILPHQFDLVHQVFQFGLSDQGIQLHLGYRLSLENLGHLVFLDLQDYQDSP